MDKKTKRKKRGPYKGDKCKTEPLSLSVPKWLGKKIRAKAKKDETTINSVVIKPLLKATKWTEPE